MNNNYGIPDHLFTVNWGVNGMSWTLATRTGQMLRELQNRYGPRDQSWTFLGIDFWDGGPMIWYPGGFERPHPKQVAIHLSREAFSNYKEAMYQLSHECVHLLSPKGESGAPVMEEGLAKLYSMEIIERECGHPCGQNYGLNTDYVDAAKTVLQLLQYNSQAIRMLRDVEPAFYRMTPATFSDAGLEQVPQPLIAELLRPF